MIVAMSPATAAVLFLENSIPRGRGGRLLFPQQFSLCQTDLADDELTGKHPAFFHCDGSRRDIAFQCAFPIDRDRLRQ